MIGAPRDELINCFNYFFASSRSRSLSRKAKSREAEAMLEDGMEQWDLEVE